MTYEELLSRDGVLVYRTRGVSMEPMLRQDRDLVEIHVPSSRLKKYDVALYRRDKSYVLHRVIDVRDGHYLIRGDNTYSIERVRDDAVVGVLAAFQRKGVRHEVTEPGYRRYVQFWDVIYPLRLVCFRAVRGAKKTARALGITPVIKRLLRRN